MDLNQLKEEAKKEIERIVNLQDLEAVFKKYLGKKGEIIKIFESLKTVSQDLKKTVGREANLAKLEIEKLIEDKSKQLKEGVRNLKLTTEKIDITRPGKKIEIGHLHPLTLVQKELEDIFNSIGFEIVQGPEVETEWYNFDALNIPRFHPARDMWDTFWLKDSQNVSSKFPEGVVLQRPYGASKVPSNSAGRQSSKLLLRTHTSPVQVRYMEKHNPPLKIIAPGRTFRREATDFSHEIQFYQLEGLMVDKNISAANFKAVIEEFLKRFLKREIEIRLRPSFFPFTEPSFEIDVSWKKGKWLELMGAGMVHPNVFKAAGLNPSQWQGFAFGVGVDRLAMLKYKINDIRLFYQNDLRFLKQF